MVTTEVRRDMKCMDHHALTEYMVYNDQTVRGMAEEVQRRLRKFDKKATFSKSTLGYLRSGERSYCSRHVAWAIEDILHTPRGTLFVERVSNVSVERGRVA